MNQIISFPPQQLSFSQKNKVWRKKCVDWGDSKTFFNYAPVRKSVMHKKINYDLLNGRLHMSDLQNVINPTSIDSPEIPDKIQHYPIMNSKLNVLRGEESKRVFDFRVVITNPNAVSQIETAKKELLTKLVQELIERGAESEEQFNQELEKINYYVNYEWQDLRELRGNALLNHYYKEYDMPTLFNAGFMDAAAVAEEIYQCDIVGGEPTLERLNPLKIRIFKSGYSNKVEDADMIVLEDYWSPGKIIDTYYDVLTQKDIKYIESIANNAGKATTDSMDNIDDRAGFIPNPYIQGEDGEFSAEDLFPTEAEESSLLPYDMAGNVRVIKVFWKSRRKIKKIKSFDAETGEEVINFYPETYVPNTDMGEEEFSLWINEAWEGTKIGEEVYVNMRPRVIQYNRLSNPSRCHFGIIGTIFNLNDAKPFSLVDLMKQYNYLYDAIHDRLNKMLARNWGKLLQLDLAKVPKGWDIDKWMYYAKVSGLVVSDSFSEGNIGAATGKLAGALNNASTGVIDAEFGQSIQSQISLLEYIKNEMAEVAGISKQREGQISNRETVGGVERATLQSSHITEWLFTQHENLKKRVLECFLETAKIALKGRSKKFQYILPDFTTQMIDIDGDEFSELDYGLAVDNSSGLQELQQKIDMLAQAALQNQTLNFSTIMKLYGSNSLAEKQRMVERNEQQIQEQRQQEQQQQMQAQQQDIQARMQQEQMRQQQLDTLNQRDNETKILVAQIAAQSKIDLDTSENSYENTAAELARKDAELAEKIRQFESKQALEQSKFKFEQKKHQDDVYLKEKAINAKPTIKK